MRRTLAITLSAAAITACGYREDVTDLARNGDPFLSVQCVDTLTGERFSWTIDGVIKLERGHGTLANRAVVRDTDGNIRTLDESDAHRFRCRRTDL